MQTIEVSNHLIFSQSDRNLIKTSGGLPWKQVIKVQIN